MKTRFKKAAIAGLMSLAALGAVSVSAMGFGGGMNTLTPDELATKQSAMFQEQATMIGATLDEVKTAWAEGKDFLTLAKEKGLTETQLQEKMKAKRDTEMKTMLQSLVTKGVITQAQADKRLATMIAQNANGKMGKMGKKGHGMEGFRF